MMWAVAARYGFTESEMWKMRGSRLAFWYEGHRVMYDEEQARMNRMMGGK